MLLRHYMYEDLGCPASTPKWSPMRNGSDINSPAGNTPVIPPAEVEPRRRRVTAETMAAKQRDISVSEFFAKNRHLLGFDNPRKALLTADSRCSECRRWIELALRKHAKRRCHT